MFHYLTLVCVHSFGRKDGGPYYPQGPFCHTYTLAGAHIHAHSLIKTSTLSICFSVFSLADSVPKAHLQG